VGPFESGILLIMSLKASKVLAIVLRYIDPWVPSQSASDRLTITNWQSPEPWIE